MRLSVYPYVNAVRTSHTFALRRVSHESRERSVIDPFSSRASSLPFYAAMVERRSPAFRGKSSQHSESTESRRASLVGSLCRILTTTADGRLRERSPGSNVAAQRTGPKHRVRRRPSATEVASVDRVILSLSLSSPSPSLHTALGSSSSVCAQRPAGVHSC